METAERLVQSLNHFTDPCHFFSFIPQTSVFFIPPFLIPSLQSLLFFSVSPIRVFKYLHTTQKFKYFNSGDIYLEQTHLNYFYVPHIVDE